MHVKRDVPSTVSVHIERSTGTWKPGTEPRVDRKDFMLICHLPLYVPCA